MILMLLLSAQAVPPPIPQTSANCVAPTYASDMTVCGDDNLRALDQALAALNRRAAMRSPDDLVIEPDEAWFTRSRRCAFLASQYACLRAAYRERIAIKTVVVELQSKTLDWQPAYCRSDAMIARIDHGVVALKTDQKVYLAVAATELASWTPYASVRHTGQSIKFRWLDGARLSCRYSAGPNASP